MNTGNRRIRPAARLDESRAEAPFAVEGDGGDPGALEVAAALQESLALA